MPGLFLNVTAVSSCHVFSFFPYVFFFSSSLLLLLLSALLMLAGRVVGELTHHVTRMQALRWRGEVTCLKSRLHGGALRFCMEDTAHLPNAQRGREREMWRDAQGGGRHHFLVSWQCFFFDSPGDRGFQSLTPRMGHN